ncbi:MAG: 50S ribosomal protein L24 [Patescibacteria group bacterium]
MKALKIIKGDKVLVIAGKDRGKSGVISLVLPRSNKVIVTGLNMVKKHLKRSPKNPQGGIIDKSMPLDASNVMFIDPKTNKPTRLGYRKIGLEKRRVTLTSNEPLERSKP